MIRIEDKTNCCGCGACYNICPKKAIEMIDDEEGFKYPVINQEKCIKCELCKKICPILNKKNSNKNIKNNNVIATYSKDAENRKMSSSGGIFSELANYIVREKRGIVFGASFDSDFNVIHQKSCDVKNLFIFKGSKYVQSDTKKTYEEAKKYLEEDRYVLYSGTPCQIDGFKSYLNKEYEKLYTCDIVCHGVPSPKVFNKYLQELEEKFNSKAKKINFKNKKYGWNNSSIQIEFNNGEKYISKLTEDNFMQGFLKNIYLRPSCYNCKFSDLPRCADISLGDFWGVEGKYEEFKDDKGTSIVLLNNKKGVELFDNIKENIYYRENCDLKYAIENNPCICGHVSEPKNRNKFFKYLDELSFNQLIKKNVKKNSKFKILIYRILKKIKYILENHFVYKKDR